MPEDETPSIARAGAYYQAGAVRDAERVCRALLATDTDLFDAAHLLGVLCLGRRAFGEALVWLRHAVALRPHETQVRENLALALIEADRGADAIAEINAAILLGRATAPRLNTLGIAYLLDRRPEAALDTIDQARALDPGLLAARFSRGRALIALRRFAEAEVETRALLELAPADRRSAVIRQLARIMAEAGHRAESWVIGQAHLSAFPNDWDMHWTVALVGLADGRLPEGWWHYEHR